MNRPLQIIAIVLTAASGLMLSTTLATYAVGFQRAERKTVELRVAEERQMDVLDSYVQRMVGSNSSPARTE